MSKRNRYTGPRGNDRNNTADRAAGQARYEKSESLEYDQEFALDVGLAVTEESDKKRREQEREALKSAKLNDARDLCALFGVPYFDFISFLGNYPDSLVSDDGFFHGAFEAFYTDRVLKDYARVRVSADTDGNTLVNNVVLSAYDGEERVLDFAIPVLEPGLTVILASSNTGKSTLVNAIAMACQDSEVDFRRFSFQEPESSTTASRLGFMSPGWRDAIASQYTRLVIVDSIKQTMRLSEPGFPTLSGGVESYFLATLSNLSAAFREAGRSIVVTVNPLFLSKETIETLEKDLIGSATGVVILDGAVFQEKARTVVVSGRYNYRSGGRAWHQFVVHAKLPKPEIETSKVADSDVSSTQTSSTAHVEKYNINQVNS